MDELLRERYQAIALLEAGHGVEEVAKQLERSPAWVRKYRRRFRQSSYAGLKEQSRAPHHVHNKQSIEMREAVIQARMELEAQAQTKGGLKYIGGPAVRTHLRKQGLAVLPSVPTIERILRSAGLTRKKAQRMEDKIVYPHVKPQKVHELIQVDIVPHYLAGGQRVACFNAIDVVSRCPTGRAYLNRRAEDAVTFLSYLWQTLGIPHYTQVDNEGCFSGGTKHPYVLGKVVRAALAVGTELVFSPTYHPQSNSHVERFHQDYDKHVWQETYLADLAEVNQRAQDFFALYQHSGHQAKLGGDTPYDRHFQPSPTLLAEELASTRQPLRPGQIHFIRQVTADKTVRILNVDWSVSAQPTTAVWATLSLQPTAAWLRIYDAAPDVETRRCLDSHPFPLTDPVVPPARPLRTKTAQVQTQPSLVSESVNSAQTGAGAADICLSLPQPDHRSNPSTTTLSRPSSLRSFVRTSLRIVQRSLVYSLLLTNQLLE
jgi:transposase InsO family protein